MVNDITPSYQSQLNDLVEELESSRIEHQKTVREVFVRWLWSDGEIIAKHPLYVYGNKTKLLDDISKRIGYSKRYLQYAVKFYNKFPYPTVDEALEAAYNDKYLQKKLGQRTILTERVVIAYLSDGKDKGAPLHREKPEEVKTLSEARKFLTIDDEVRIIRGDRKINFLIVPDIDDEDEFETQI